MASREEARVLDLHWSYGFTVTSPNAVGSLSRGAHHVLVYASSHTVVIHDISKGTQKLLQGHRNPISALCVSPDKKWFATADGRGRGLDPSTDDDCIIIVWDAIAAAPVRVLEGPPGGVVSMDMSADGMSLTTISNASPQRVDVWEWSLEQEEPVASAQFAGDHDFQHSVRFNAVDVREIVSTGNVSCVFFSWSDSGLAANFPEHGVSKLPQTLGRLTQTVFIPYTSKAVSGTTSGDIVLWDFPASEDGRCRNAIKLIKLSNKPAGINILDIVDKYLVAGGRDGAVRFYDFQFRVFGWFEDLKCGEVTAISFNEVPVPATAASAGMPSASALDSFVVPNFVVSTATGKVLSCDVAEMNNTDSELRKGIELLRGFDGDITCVSCHPAGPWVVVGTDMGTLQLWDYEEHRLLCTRRYNHPIRQMAFRSSGDILAVGLSSGHIRIVSCDGLGGHSAGFESKKVRLTDVQVFHHSSSAMCHFAFSEHGSYLAAADVDRYVSLFHYTHANEDQQQVEMEWVYLGRHRSHFRSVTSLKFAPAPFVHDEEASRVHERKAPSAASSRSRKHHPRAPAAAVAVASRDTPRLFSLGADGFLQEYNVGQSSIRTGLRLKHTTRVEQSSCPCDMLVMPLTSCMELSKNHPNYAELQHKTALAIVNDDYKVRVWYGSSTSESVDTCVKTTLAPAYGAPVSRIHSVPSTGKGSSQFVAYGTDDKVVGVVKLPLDGNPNHSMALIAHPGLLSGLECSFDGRYLVTAGRDDRSLKMWSIDTDALDTSAAQQSGDAMQPFVQLLDSGGSGALAGRQLHDEMVDLFYYCQLRHQGLESTAPRNITGKIPVDEAIRLLRGVGYFPSKEEVMFIQNQVMFAAGFSAPFESAGIERVKLTFEEVLKLYTNYRPVVPLGMEQLEEAFAVLGVSEEEKLSRTLLVETLLKQGESMTEEELGMVVHELLEHRGETGQEVDDEEPLDAEFTAHYFADKVLSMQAIRKE